MPSKPENGTDAKNAIGTILVVEDDEALLTLIQRTLSKVGFKTTGAATGGEAIAAATNDPPPGLLLLDYRLPDMTGEEVIKKLAGLGRHIPFIVTTGHGGESIAVEMMKLGARDYLIKNSSFLEQLPQVVEAVSGHLLVERRLAETQAALVESSNDGIIVIQDGLLKFTNPRMTEILGFSAAALGRPFFDFVAPAYRELTIERYRKRMAGIETPSKYEIEVLHKNGQIVAVEVNASIINYEGKVADMAIVRDITERKKTESTLTSALAQADRFRQALDHVSAYVYMKDPQSRYVYANQQTLELFGCSAEELRGYDDTRFFPPETARKLREIDLRALGGEQTQEEIEVLGADRGKRVYWDVKTPIYAEPGSKTVWGLLGIATDITERRKMEDNLREGEERYRAITQGIAESILIVSPDYKILWANNVALAEAGRTLSALVGQPCFKMTHQRDTPCDEGDQCPVAEFYNTGEAVTVEHIHTDKQGTRHNVEVSAYPVRDNSGKITQFIHVSRDITERKLAQEQMREAEILREYDKLRADLISNVSHELRTPLASIKGFSTTLLQTDVKWSEEEQRDFLQTISSEADRLNRIINDLLDTSRLEAGRLSLERRDVTVMEILDTADAALKTLGRNHPLEISVADGLPSVFVDVARIDQVITNLVENAAKFSPPGTPITIEARAEKDQVIFSVTDKGIGIPPEVIGKLFDRFYQAQSVVRGKERGTGLGLYISRGIVEAHGGKIWVESKAGQGSKFSFSVPVAKKE